MANKYLIVNNYHIDMSGNKTFDVHPSILNVKKGDCIYTISVIDTWPFCNYIPTCELFQFDVTNNKGINNNPFIKAKPCVSSFKPGALLKFDGGDIRSFKCKDFRKISYTITIGDYKLDPTIIVDET